MERQLLIFDLDGTLVDSVEDLATAVNLSRADFGLNPIPVGQVARYVGDGIRMLMVRSLQDLPGADIDLAVQRQRAHYQAHLCDRTQPYEGVSDGLKLLKKSGHALAIATNKPAEITEKLLAALGIRHLFDAVYGGGSVSDLKPHPAMLDAAMATLGFDRAHTWMVGDNRTDLEAARRAGVRSVLMQYGIGDPGPEKPDLTFETFPAFVHHIEAISA